MEIERKFLVETLPEHLEQYPKRRIQQAYLSTDPVVRVRRSGEEYVLTCKGPGFLSREEQEMPLTAAAYGRLLAKADGTVITKDRWRIPCGPYTIELDVFAQPFAPLVMAEVEFPTEAEALAFQPPEWFGREVTQDSAYTNAALSRRCGEDAVRPGRYRHFKGKEYRVLYTATHSETLEPMVVYRQLYGQGGLWVRPAGMWNEIVDKDGYHGPRFRFVED